MNYRTSIAYFAGVRHGWRKRNFDEGKEGISSDEVGVF